MRAQMMSVDEIHAAPDNLRHDVGRLKELQTSIEAVGILQPLVVHTNGDGKYEIIAGHRRFAAAKHLGLAEVPVVIRDDLADAAKIEAMIVENFHREDLTPIEQAEGLFRLEELGLARAEISAKTGLSKRLVTERIKLMDLTPKGRDAIHQGKLSIEAGLELAKEATSPGLIDEAISAILAGEVRDPARAVADVKSNLKHADMTARLMVKVEKLQELGKEVVVKAHYQEADGTRGWKRIIGPEDKGYFHSGEVRVDPKVHAKEECAGFIFDPGRAGQYGQLPSLSQLCKKPNRHTFTGASEIKVEKAQQEHDAKAQQREINKAERDRQAAMRVRYEMGLVKKPPRKLIADLAIAGFIHKIYAEHKKGAAQLLGLEPREPSYEGGPKDWTTPFEEFAVENPERAVLALVMVDQEPLSGLNQWNRYLTDETLAQVLALIPEASDE